MNTRKIAAAAGFATGAALAFAPFASADTTDAINFGSLVTYEIAAENSTFNFDALLSGVPSADYPLAGQGFYTILPADLAQYAPHLTDAADASQVTPLEYLLYGVNPIEAGISSDSGAFNVYNGAMTEFYDAYNSELYTLTNPGGTVPVADLFGSDTTINAAIASGNPAEYFYNQGVGDLQGYLGDFGTTTTQGVASAASSTTDISSTVSSEISSANSLFESYAALAGLPTGDIVSTTGSFDTLASGLTDSPQLDAFDTAVFGFNPASVSPDPGAYDLFNGAISKFDDAFNVGLYALENSGNMIPGTDFATDLFGVSGTLANELAGETATQAITTFLQAGVSDIAGYFDFGSLAGL